MMEIIKCEDSKINVIKKVPMVSCELSNGIQFFATHESKSSLKVGCTASQSISIQFPKEAGTFDPNDSEDDDFVLKAIPETWVASIVKEKIEVEAQEGID